MRLRGLPAASREDVARHRDGERRSSRSPAPAGTARDTRPGAPRHKLRCCTLNAARARGPLLNVAVPLLAEGLIQRAGAFRGAGSYSAFRHLAAGHVRRCGWNGPSAAVSDWIDNIRSTSLAFTCNCDVAAAADDQTGAARPDLQPVTGERDMQLLPVAALARCPAGWGVASSRTQRRNDTPPWCASKSPARPRCRRSASAPWFVRVSPCLISSSAQISCSR